MLQPMLSPTNVAYGPDIYDSWAEQPEQKVALKSDVAGISHSQALAKLKLSHTPAEHQLYQALWNEADSSNTRVCAFSTRRLMILSQLPNYSAVRRALHGLINKLSIEDYRIAGDLLSLRQTTVYLIYSPEEILTRRTACAPLGQSFSPDSAFDQAVERVADFRGLSRREAQVALCCVEGLTNTEIGRRLHISEQTVKYHMRHIFVKYGVRRRTELVSRLLSQAAQSETIKASIELPEPPV